MEEDGSQTLTKVQENLNKIHPLGAVTMAVSPDFNQIAVSIKEENVVNIYEINQEKPGKWTKQYEIREHIQSVSVVDWGYHNLLLTGSFDKGVFVWRFNSEEDKWKPEMVIGNNQNRAILDGCWSPVGNKFAFGTGSYKLFLGYIDPTNGWWFSELLSSKKFSASVISVAFHPTGNVVAAGTADGKVRLYSSFIPDLDVSTSGPFGNITSKGEELYRFEIGSWVENIAWSPSGKFAMFSGHNSSVHQLLIGDDNSITEKEDAIVWNGLPFRSTFLFDDSSFYAGGYDQKPLSFKFKEGKW